MPVAAALLVPNALTSSVWLLEEPHDLAKTILRGWLVGEHRPAVATFPPSMRTSTLPRLDPLGPPGRRCAKLPNAKAG